MNVDSGGGAIVIASVTMEADRELGLTKGGDRALAIIETADVIVGKE